MVHVRAKALDVLVSPSETQQFFVVESGECRTVSARVDPDLKLACDSILPGGFFGEGALYGDLPTPALGFRVEVSSRSASLYRLSAEAFCELRARVVDEHAEEATDDFVAATAVAVSDLPQRRCRGCGVMFAPAPGSNANSRQGMRCSACNADYDQNFVRDTVRGSCHVQ